MYNDGFCSLFYTTNLLKDGCLACIGSSYDKYTKMGTSVLIGPDILYYLCSCIEGISHFIFWWRRDNIDPPVISAVITSR